METITLGLTGNDGQGLRCRQKVYNASKVGKPTTRLGRQSVSCYNTSHRCCCSWCRCYCCCCCCFCYRRSTGSTDGTPSCASSICRRYCHCCCCHVFVSVGPMACLLSAMILVDSGASLSAARKRCVPLATTSCRYVNSRSNHIPLRKKSPESLVVEFYIFIFHLKRLFGDSLFDQSNANHIK